MRGWDLLYKLILKTEGYCHLNQLIEIINPLNTTTMKVILDIHNPSCLCYNVQQCSTPEGFESIRMLHPEDEFIIADEDSLNKWDDLMEFLESMCWNINDYFAVQNIESDLAALEEELEMEALYGDYMAEELAWYNHARQMGWE